MILDSESHDRELGSRLRRMGISDVEMDRTLYLSPSGRGPAVRLVTAAFGSRHRGRLRAWRRTPLYYDGDNLDVMQRTHCR
jgi:hypothetical protein